MQQFAFSQNLAAEVKRRMDILNLNNEWLNGVMLATAQANGCGPTDRVKLKADGSGIVVELSETLLEGLRQSRLETVANSDAAAAVAAGNGKRK